MTDKAVVLMYYGFPEKREEMKDYLRDILHGKEPSEAMIKENLDKLDAVGGQTPSTIIVKRIREKIEERLEGEGFSVYLLSKHYRPPIREAGKFVKENIVYEIPLFPIYSKFIFDGYFAPLESQLNGKKMIRVSNIGFESEFIEYFRSRITSSPESILVFSAHSIPSDGYDPYSELFLDLSEKIARGRKHINIYHSQGPFHTKWLTPYADYSISYARENGFKEIEIAPIGFIYDHLEVLYDLDFKLRNEAMKEGLEYKRIELPNDSDAVVTSILKAAELQ
jgi:ferrochelatase